MSAPEERMLCDRSTYKVAHAKCTKTGVVRELTLSRMCPDISGMISKGGIEGGGWVHPKGADSMAISELSLEMLWLALGGPLLSSYAQVG